MNASARPRANHVTSRNERVAILPMVMLAQEDRARVRDHFHLCLRNAASVTRNPEVRARAGIVVPHRPGDVLRVGEVMPEDSPPVPSTADAGIRLVLVPMCRASAAARSHTRDLVFLVAAGPESRRRSVTFCSCRMRTW